MLAVVSLGIFGCGAMMAFVLSPKDALEWRNIEALPELDASGFSALKTGDQAAITGKLADNKTLTADGLVAYEKDVWKVSQPDSSSSTGTPATLSGSWNIVETHAPELSVTISGGTITTATASQVTIGGNLHVTFQPSSSTLIADYQGTPLPDQSTRLQGFDNGDLLTVVGQKSSTGALIPSRLYGGDRVQLVNDIRQQAQSYFAAGVAAMICAPILLIVGSLSLVFGRRRGLFG